MTDSDKSVVCPNCRGPAIVRAVWSYARTGAKATPPQAPTLGRAPTAAVVDELDAAPTAANILQQVRMASAGARASANVFALGTPRTDVEDFRTPEGTPDSWYGVWWPSDAKADSTTTQSCGTP